MLVWFLQVTELLGSQIQTVCKAFYKCNIIHRRKTPLSRRQLNICLPIGDSKWILILPRLQCRFCFTYSTVFISIHKFFSYTRLIFSTIPLQWEWASGCRKLNCWPVLDQDRREKIFPPSLGDCGGGGNYWCKQGFSRTSVSDISTLYVNKLLEYIKWLWCVSNIGAHLMKSDLYSVNCVWYRSIILPKCQSRPPLVIE